MQNAKCKILTIFFTAVFVLGSFNVACAKSVNDKIKDFIDDASDSLKRGVDKCGDNLAAAQEYLDHYHWKGVIQDEATSDMVTLKHLQLNGHSKAVVVRPGERIEGVVLCNVDRSQCSSLSMYRVVLGIKSKGPQTTIGNEFGLVAGESLENFVLIAPAEKGIYQIRFRPASGLLEKTALNSWLDEKGDEPSGTTTIGIIVVK